ncbi:hypothetical protein [Noviherbaspirillum soli]|uniref:hypothetical protein n=1 Tax=Noviherbaspirillum soli TaxID=1064518 RepID=UPI00188D2546|nr:hypothetical protein [Noviherbaspirillum soli]
MGNLDGNSNVSEKWMLTGNIYIDFKKFMVDAGNSKTAARCRRDETPSVKTP